MGQDKTVVVAEDKGQRRADIRTRAIIESYHSIELVYRLHSRLSVNVQAERPASSRTAQAYCYAAPPNVATGTIRPFVIRRRCRRMRSISRSVLAVR